MMGPNSGNELWHSLRNRRSKILTRLELMAKGLYFGAEDRVNMESFNRLHQVELPDGRRFISEDCAIAGLAPGRQWEVKKFWEQNSAEILGREAQG